MIMKKLNKYILMPIVLTLLVSACKDEDLVIVPEWGTAVHGRTVLSSGSATNFLSGDPGVDLSFELLWNSIDGENTVVKIEVFAFFNEAFIDKDGNPKTASHGGADGVSLLTLEGAAVPANKQTTSFSISQDDIYALYSTATFDYDEDGTSTPVWNNPDKPDRNTSNLKFIDGDSFEITWKFTTDDGRVFDSWSPSVCTEFPGANCTVSWAVVCSQVISSPPGDYVIAFTDTYGDGWNGAAIKVVVDGVGTDYTLANGSSGSTTVTVPAGSTSISFEFVSGDWDSEVLFTITSPRGNVIASGGPSPGEGVIRLNLCKGE